MKMSHFLTKRLAVSVGFVLCASVPLRATTRSVCASGCDYPVASLQTALNASTCGDTVTLKAAEVYRLSNIRIPNAGNCSANPITVRTDTMANVPALGTRLCIPQTITGHPEQTWTCATDHSKLMPKIRSAQSPLMLIEPLARGWTFEGIEFDHTYAGSHGTGGSTIIVSGKETDDVTNITTVERLPSYVRFEHVYIHGAPDGAVSHGIVGNIKNFVLRDSVMRHIQGDGSQSNGISIYNSPGPFLIDNNELNMLATQGILVGGAFVAISKLIPCDFTITNNWFTSRRTGYKGDANWDGVFWKMGNKLEFKSACRAQVSHNIFEYTWPTGQLGTLFVVVAMTDVSDGCSWCTVYDVMFENNILRHANNGMGFTRYPNLNVPFPTNLIARNNLLYDISEDWYWPGAAADNCSDFSAPRPCGRGQWLEIGGGVRNITIAHNTADHRKSNNYGTKFTTGGFLLQNVTIRDNFFWRAAFGLAGDGNPTACAGEGTRSITGCDSGTPIFLKNVIADAVPTQSNRGNPPVSPTYPATTTFITTSAWDAIFENIATGDYRVKTGSAYKAGGARAATDGADLGVNMCNGAFPDPTTAAGPTVGKATFNCGKVIPKRP